MLSNRQRRFIIQVLPFGLVPAVFSLIQGLLEEGILGDYPVYPATGNPNDLNIAFSVLTSFVVGSLIGAGEVLFVNKWLKNRSFGFNLLIKSTAYVFAIIVATVIIVSSGHSIGLNASPFSPEVSTYVWNFFSSFAFWSIICFYAVAIVIAVFYSEVINNMGQALFINFFSGEYHRPKTENRVYMFLDMKSSTTHAESLGHIKYFQMLKEYYEAISDPIIDFGGEVYQYVGDEVVITWKVKKNFASNAIQCFFAMKQSLKNRSGEFLKKYGIAPEFKAGIHFGEVTTGEIGVVKRDIAFSGDVLNTTARIQGLCNQYKTNLLASDVFVEALPEDTAFQAKALGNVELRGRNEKIDLFTIEE